MLQLKTSLSDLGTISLQTRTKLQSPSKEYLPIVNYRLLSKVKINTNNFRRKQCSQIFTSGVVYKFQFELRKDSYYGKCVRDLAVTSDEQIGTSPLTNKG